MIRSRDGSRGGRAVVQCLFASAFLVLMVVVGGTWLVRGSTWTHQQRSYTPDPSNPEARTVDQIGEATSGRASFRKECWREVRVRNDEWVKDGPFTQWDRAGTKLAEGAYRMGKRH